MVTDGTPTDASTAGDDAGLSATDAGFADSGSTDAFAPDALSNDAGTAPVQCGAIAQRWDLCGATDETCSAVFRDSAGCNTVCAEAGLTCIAAYEDITNQCAADTARPAIGCAATGHASDYCVCGHAGTTTTAPPGPTEDCSSYPFRSATLLAERAGYGQRATGGDPNNVYRVTTLQDDGAGSLRRALESNIAYWIVFDVSGHITLASPIDVRSNKTVDGRGRDILVEGNLIFSDVRNVIVSDIRMKNELDGHCTQAGDVVTILGSGRADPAGYTSRDIWFNHVELFNGGDGLFDIRGGSRITVSWTHFHTHKKGLLNWSTREGDPAPGMRVTYHHNFFDRISLRGPQFIFGRCHFYNNYQFEWYEYGAGGLGGAHFLSENNIYQARPGRVCVPACPDPNPCGDSDFVVSKRALVSDWASNGAGNVKSSGDLLLEGALTEERNASTVFSPSADYPYTPEPATMNLATRVRDGAGPRVDYCH